MSKDDPQKQQKSPFDVFWENAEYRTRHIRKSHQSLPGVLSDLTGISRSTLRDAERTRDIAFPNLIKIAISIGYTSETYPQILDPELVRHNAIAVSMHASGRYYSGTGWVPPDDVDTSQYTLGCRRVGDRHIICDRTDDVIGSDWIPLTSMNMSPIPDPIPSSSVRLHILSDDLSIAAHFNRYDVRTHSDRESLISEIEDGKRETIIIIDGAPVDGDIYNSELLMMRIRVRAGIHLPIIFASRKHAASAEIKNIGGRTWTAPRDLTTLAKIVSQLILVDDENE